MTIEFIQKTSSANLILIFAGWGSDAKTFGHLVMPGWDVAVVSGIDSEIPDFSIFASYTTIYLYAWSLGVWMAERTIPDTMNITKAYAVNGTVTPYDDARGIAKAIFTGTYMGLCERSLYKFRVRMCGHTTYYALVKDKFEHVNDISRLKNELEYVMSNSSPTQLPKIQWSMAYIGKNDAIFTPNNQTAAWKNVTRTEMIDAPHYVDLQTIIRQTIIDVTRVGKRFSRSLSTYDAHSHAQRMIAETLAGMLQNYQPSDFCHKIIELGCGTGNFTRQWSRLMRPHSALFIDLCDTPVFNAADNEKYVTGDAEEEMKRLAVTSKEEYNAVLSASTIQWFSNLPLFFKNSAEVLQSNGIIAFSTFAPGNLEELHALRPDHLQYLSVEELHEIVSCYFENVIISEDIVRLEFSNPLEALRHLQLTGVTASGSRRASVSELRKFVETYPMNGRGRYPLTFRPIYILARKS